MALSESGSPQVAPITYGSGGKSKNRKPKGKSKIAVRPGGKQPLMVKPRGRRK